MICFSAFIENKVFILNHITFMRYFGIESSNKSQIYWRISIKWNCFVRQLCCSMWCFFFPAPEHYSNRTYKVIVRTTNESRISASGKHTNEVDGPRVLVKCATISFLLHSLFVIWFFDVIPPYYLLCIWSLALTCSLRAISKRDREKLTICLLIQLLTYHLFFHSISNIIPITIKKHSNINFY